MNPRHRSRRGFTLVEILIVVVILGLIMAMASVLLRSITATQKRSVTATRLTNIESALVQFVMLQKRLPCPADGTASAGTEVRTPGGVCNPGNQQNGVVPWVTLGLSAADATDGWDRRITYRTDSNLVKDNGMDLSWCDPAGTGGLGGGGACNSACTSSALASCTPPATYTNGKGLTVRNVGGTPAMDPAGTPPTGAAYVLISHGESGGGALLTTGALFAGTTTDGTEEQKNYANLVLAGYYVDDQATDVPGTAHFDDIVVRPSVLNVATKAGLGPRSH
jgi:prepilin-type N-terminal cleavage/methylation domain-containing protein